jgi:membrane-associated protease RseP (regulator of RpoE activity)/sRNA-binding regulator protein Hfq
MARVRIGSLILLFFLLSRTQAGADTIYLKNGTEMKGIIVEDYRDRYVISTYEGEKTVFKQDIIKAVYDLIEQNLAQLGDEYLERGEYEKAYFYYSKANSANPDYAPAQEKVNYVTGHLFRRLEKEKLKKVKEREAIESWPAEPPKKDESTALLLEKRIGIQIAEDRNRVTVTAVMKDSPAARSGVREGDIIVSIWGKLTGYMSEEDVAGLLLREAPGEIRLIVARQIVIQKSDPGEGYAETLGGKLDMLFDGLTLAGVDTGTPGEPGLEEGDLIFEINGTATRYMPLKEAIRIIEKGTADTLYLTVVRNVTIWGSKR